MSESFGRFADFSDPGSPRVSHGLGNLRRDEARARTGIGQVEADVRTNVPVSGSGESLQRRLEVRGSSRAEGRTTIAYGERAGTEGGGRGEEETDARTRGRAVEGHRRTAEGVGAQDTSTQSAGSPGTQARGGRKQREDRDTMSGTTQTTNRAGTEGWMQRSHFLLPQKTADDASVA